MKPYCAPTYRNTRWIRKPHKLSHTRVRSLAASDIRDFISKNENYDYSDDFYYEDYARIGDYEMFDHRLFDSFTNLSDVFDPSTLSDAFGRHWIVKNVISFVDLCVRNSKIIAENNDQNLSGFPPTLKSCIRPSIAL